MWDDETLLYKLREEAERRDDTIIHSPSFDVFDDNYRVAWGNKNIYVHDIINGYIDKIRVYSITPPTRGDDVR